MKNFDELGLHPNLNYSLEKMQYKTPTPIQAKAIPFALDGRDIMGSAQTGTGKTAAFAIPLIQHLLNSEESCALVLTPTRELGKQIMEIMHQLLGNKSQINTAFLIGGDSMQKQNNQLKKRPRLIVGTPGRINDHLERGSLYLKKTDFLVLDETDRMLDMGFSVQLDRIFKYLPDTRQTLMFSATLPKDILRMSESYLTNPERIAVGSTFNPAENIKQETIHLTDGEKFDVLAEELDKRSGTIVVFVKTKYATERMAKRLKAQGMEADAIHGDLKQSRRSRVIQNFRDLKFRILVATDVVARGLDIPHIEHVINYDLPQVPEDYIHRIGRTARAGAKGCSLCLITPQDGRKWDAIEMLMNPGMKSKYAPERKGKGKGSRGGKDFFKGKPRKGKGKSTRGGGFRGDDRPAKSFSKKKPYQKSDDNRSNRNSNDNRGSNRDDFYGDKPKSFKKKENGGKSNYRGDKKPYGDKPKSFKNKRDDRAEGQSDFKKKPFKKKFSDNRNSSNDGDQPRGRSKSYEGKPNGKPVNKSGKKPFGKSGSKPAGKKTFGKPGAKSGGGKFGQSRGTPKGAPQKGKRVFKGKKSKQAER